VNTLFGCEEIKGAALELMVESLEEEATERRLRGLLNYHVDLEGLAKAARARSLAAGYYDAANYLMWLRGMIESGVDLELNADEAEGLSFIASARYEFERDHPACPQCGTRQCSTRPIMCRKCKLNFRSNR
jgi:hypothetical protein